MNLRQLTTVRARRVRRTVMTLAATVGVLAASACSSGGNNAGGDTATRTVASAYGDIEVPEDPERVVAVTYDTPLQLRSLGITPVATLDYSISVDGLTEEQQRYLAAPDSVGSAGSLDFEAVAKAEPDLIVGDAMALGDGDYERLAAIAPTVLVRTGNWGDWQGVTAGIAEAVGRTGELSEGKKRYEQHLAELGEKYRDVLEDTTFASVAPMDENSFAVHYPTGPAGAVYREIGMRTASSIPSGDFPNGWEKYSDERITDVLGEADVVIVPAGPDGSVLTDVASLTDNVQFQNLRAAKEEKVVGVFVQITDYSTAESFLSAVEKSVLRPLQE
ncbi:Putative ABC transporter substrate-binding lipoprotein YhfQ [Corynebacterium provencense]|uniref:ABC transporter substrate-binding lipoprotein YhfQ n=2 Tax=Corynebacterium provencense TaxID=1737425 RepID=A0A2Z3Z0X6_9CORY|nr:Putative ABC transporter substrate-binding lipoprotein YhfQ [Corynebacterium provencense]